MILRYIIFIIIGFFFYLLIKRFLSPTLPRTKTTEEASEMVLDQHCSRYILKKNALKLNQNGKDMFFCCDECMQKYKKDKNN